MDTRYIVASDNEPERVVEWTICTTPEGIQVYAQCNGHAQSVGLFGLHGFIRHDLNREVDWLPMDEFRRIKVL